MNDPDETMMAVLADGWVGHECTIELPSGRIVTGADVARWIEAQRRRDDAEKKISVLRVFDGLTTSVRYELPPGSTVRFGQREIRIAPGQEVVVGPTSEPWVLVEQETT